MGRVTFGERGLLSASGASALEIDPMTWKTFAPDKGLRGNGPELAPGLSPPTVFGGAWRRRDLLRWLALGLGVVLEGDVHPILAEVGASRGPGETPRGKGAKQEAVSRIPLDQLSPAWRSQVLDVVNHAAMFQVMHSPIIECEPDFYRFLVEHPEVIVAMWQALGITKLKLDVLGPRQYRLDDSAGTIAQVVYIYTGATQHVVYSEGSYSGPLMLRPVRGKVVVVLNSSFLREAGGTPYVSAQLDLYVQVEQAGMELLTRALHPLLGSMTENNYQQTMNFVGSVYRTARLRPVTLQRLTADLKIDSQTRQTLADWITRLSTWEKSEQTRAAMADGLPSLDEQSLRPERILRQ